MNGDFEDHTEALTECAKDTRWRYDQELMPDEAVEPPTEAQVAKFNESQNPQQGQHVVTVQQPKLQKMESTKEMVKHTYPPPEWVRLWLLIGRCHLQFFRDWVRIQSNKILNIGYHAKRDETNVLLSILVFQSHSVLFTIPIPFYYPT